MGGGRWSADDFKSYSGKNVGKTTQQIFTKTSLDNTLNPKGIKIRESCDSLDNPNSHAVILGVDVTGSMGHLATLLVKAGLNTAITEIHQRKPISDPHIMLAAIGDVECDLAPLQVTQFEADLRLLEQTEKFFVEGGGGGNGWESYSFLWYFAATKTKIDCWEKRRKKGYLFTIGDEEPTRILRSTHIEEFVGDKPERNEFTSEELLRMVSRTYHVFHLMVEESNTFRINQRSTKEMWQNLLGERALLLSDYNKMSEVIVSTIQICEGHNKDKVVNSWDGSTNLVVKRATASLPDTSSSNAIIIY